MDNSLLFSNIGRHIEVREDDAALFVTLLQGKKLRRKECLVREGEICHHSFFVSSGCLRGYTLDKNGYEHVLQFAPPGWWITDMYSMLTRQPGVLYIEALEPSEVLMLHIDDRERLLLEAPAFERYFRMLAENSLASFRQRLMDNLGLPARERYLRFCRQYPELIERLPQKQIAAYIGVTPEFLSKIRAEIHKNRKRISDPTVSP